MITPVYGSWRSHKTTESQRVFASDRTPSKSSVLRADAIVGKTGNVLGCGLEGAIPEVSVLCEFANCAKSGRRLRNKSEAAELNFAQ